jgi:chemotaxis protein MotB
VGSRPFGSAEVTPDQKPHEIIIIKRGGEGEEGHHGGAWKIAFADFMTAMMALFLVLWLVNAANEETKKAVASYFNPVKLVDRNQSRRGLDEQKGGPTEGAEAGADKSAEKPAEDLDREAEFFKSPMTALSEIIAEEKVEERSQSGESLSRETGFTADDANLPDPFSPLSNPPSTMEQTDSNQAKPVTSESTKSVLAHPNPVLESGQDVSKKPKQEIPVQHLIGPSLPTQKKSEDRTRFKRELIKETAAGSKFKEKDGKSTDGLPTGREERIIALSEEIIEELNSEIRLAFDKAELMQAALSVRPVDEGVLITLTDAVDYPMFEIGSAVPQKRVVLVMEKIGQIIAKRKGGVRIYGHTDGRAYRAVASGNWQLSCDRALAAYYMLARSGMNEARITQVSGFADRNLRDAANPLADANRRIELLLEVR